jgi:hypothetical protein
MGKNGSIRETGPSRRILWMMRVQGGRRQRQDKTCRGRVDLSSALISGSERQTACTLPSWSGYSDGQSLTFRRRMSRIVVTAGPLPEQVNSPTVCPRGLMSSARCCQAAATCRTVSLPPRCSSKMRYCGIKSLSTKRSSPDHCHDVDKTVADVTITKHPASRLKVVHKMVHTFLASLDTPTRLPWVLRQCARPHPPLETLGTSPRVVPY